MPNVYYWNAVPNFGDRLAVTLVNNFCPPAPWDWSEIQFADVLTTGSILEQVPEDYAGIVAGPGVLVAASRVKLPLAKVLAVRGQHTLDRLECQEKESVVLGDPGLLVDELVNIRTRDRLLGILPHWTDTRLANDGRFQQFDPLIISPFDSPLDVAAQVGRCHKLVTSSLHGIIFADAFGIPRRFERSPRMLPEEGGLFKYHDYHTAIGMEMEIGVTQQADRHRVEDVKHRLYDVFMQIRDRI